MPKQHEALLIIGGNDDFTKEVALQFGGIVHQVGRRTNHDINSEEARARLARKSLKYKWVLLHAHGQGFAQTEFLYQIFEAWVEADREGHIFVTGSYVTYQPNDKFSRYLLNKKSLDIAVQQCSKILETESHPFRLTNLKCGMLDSLKSQGKPHWEGHGLSGTQLAQVMKSILGTPKNVQIPEVVLASMPSLIER